MNPPWIGHGGQSPQGNDRRSLPTRRSTKRRSQTSGLRRRPAQFAGKNGGPKRRGLPYLERNRCQDCGRFEVPGHGLRHCPDRRHRGLFVDPTGAGRIRATRRGGHRAVLRATGHPLSACFRPSAPAEPEEKSKSERQREDQAAEVGALLSDVSDAHARSNGDRNAEVPKFPSIPERLAGSVKVKA
jgi:hypothetical protein